MNRTTLNQGLAPVLNDAIRQGRPIPADAAELIDRASPPQLWHALRTTNVRDVFLGSFPGAEESGDSDGRQGRGRVSLHKTMMAIQQGQRHTDPFKILSAVRFQFNNLLQDLPLVIQRRMRHALQVQLCPPVIQEQLLKLAAITFSVGSRTIDLPSHAVQLSLLRAQWLTSGRLGNGRVSSVLQEGAVRLSESLRELELASDVRYEFSANPSYGNGTSISLNSTVSFENGLACHEALEEAILCQYPVPKEIDMPRAYAIAETDSAFLPSFLKEGISPAMEKCVMDRLELWWEKQGDTAVIEEMITKRHPKLGKRVNPTFWLNAMKAENEDAPPIANRLPVPVSDFKTVQALLTEEQAHELLGSVWYSEMRETSQHVLMPLDLLSAEDLPEATKDRSRLMVYFPANFVGRDSWTSSKLTQHQQAAAVQVVELDN